jgi:single-strand DNA-binding protein
VAQDINTVNVSGRLTADPTVRKIGENSVCECRIAIGRSYLHDGEWKDSSSFVSVEIWNGRGAHLTRVGKKGDLLHFSGEIRSSEWKDDEGNNRSRVFIRATNVLGEALFRKADKGDESPAPDGQEVLVTA